MAPIADDHETIGDRAMRAIDARAIGTRVRAASGDGDRGAVRSAAMREDRRADAVLPRRAVRARAASAASRSCCRLRGRPSFPASSLDNLPTMALARAITAPAPASSWTMRS
ncbi:MAG: hypothetical protein WDW36_008297 [Sanguina aurantia]